MNIAPDVAVNGKGIAVPFTDAPGVTRKFVQPITLLLHSDNPNTDTIKNLFI